MTKILIIDDSILARMAVRKCLPQDKNYEIYEASDGAEGLAKYKELNPDIVFLDLTMPVMDGFATLEAIRNINNKAIVLVLTADIQTKTAERVLNLGATLSLKKPPIKSEILDALDKAHKALEEA